MRSRGSPRGPGACPPRPWATPGSSGHRRRGLRDPAQDCALDTDLQPTRTTQRLPGAQSRPPARDTGRQTPPETRAGPALWSVTETPCRQELGPPLGPRRVQLTPSPPPLPHRARRAQVPGRQAASRGPERHSWAAAKPTAPLQATALPSLAPAPEAPGAQPVCGGARLPGRLHGRPQAGGTLTLVRPRHPGPKLPPLLAHLGRCQVALEATGSPQARDLGVPLFSAASLGTRSAIRRQITARKAPCQPTAGDGTATPQRPRPPLPLCLPDAGFRVGPGRASHGGRPQQPTHRVGGPRRPPSRP